MTPLRRAARSAREFLSRKLTPDALKIGVSARLFHPQPDAKGIQSKTLQYLEQSIAHWVMSRDVLVFMVPTVDKDGLLHRSEVRLADYARALDGLVLQGGSDVSPSTYGETPLAPQWSGDRLRDVYEMELVHEFIEAGKPVLGICRGAQLINVAFGGTLYQDIPTQVAEAQVHVTDAYERHRHDVRFEPGSGLARLYRGVEKPVVTSIHHQSVKALGRGLRVEAWSEPDGVVEAIRGTGKSYVLAVQWHPEFHHPGDKTVLNSAPILEEFLEAARGG
ncbi:MAG TPA: type 1 glutamine amidotransferase [Burkholderiales bacterium]